MTKRNSIAYNLQDIEYKFTFVSVILGVLGVIFVLGVLMSGGNTVSSLPAIFVPLGIYASGKILKFIGFLLETEERELFFP